MTTKNPTALTERGIIGRYFKALEDTNAASWVGPASVEFSSDQFQEVIRFLGDTPKFKKWEAERTGKTPTVSEVVILNEDYEATLDFRRREFTADKTGQVMNRVDGFGERSSHHWASMMTNLLVNGDSTAAYDGVNFFATTHAEGASGTQSNLKTISGITAPTAPTAAEMESAILDAVADMLKLVDSEGEPMNELASSFHVIVPAGIVKAAATALGAPIIVDGSASRTNVLATVGNWTFSLTANARLDIAGWNTTNSDFVIIRTDGNQKPLIRLADGGIRTTFLGPDSEHCKKSNQVLFGAEATRGAGYGYWQYAHKVILTA